MNRQTLLVYNNTKDRATVIQLSEPKAELVREFLSNEDNNTQEVLFEDFLIEVENAIGEGRLLPLMECHTRVTFADLDCILPSTFPNHDVLYAPHMALELDEGLHYITDTF